MNPTGLITPCAASSLLHRSTNVVSRPAGTGGHARRGRGRPQRRRAVHRTHEDRGRSSVASQTSRRERLVHHRCGRECAAFGRRRPRWVELRDAFRVVVNPDLVRHLPGPPCERAGNRSTPRSGTAESGVFVADVGLLRPTWPVNVLGPALEHLADRLAEMDRAAVECRAQGRRAAVVRRRRTFADMLASTVKGWRTGQSEPGDPARRSFFAQAARQGQPRPLGPHGQPTTGRWPTGRSTRISAQRSTSAAQTARAQLADGFGKGRDQWIEEIHNAAPGAVNFRPARAGVFYVEARG